MKKIVIGIAVLLYAIFWLIFEFVDASTLDNIILLIFVGISVLFIFAGGFEEK
jgi:hypothetical protein